MHQVTAGQDAEADDVGVLFDDGPHDRLRALPRAEIDDLKSGVAQAASH